MTTKDILYNAARAKASAAALDEKQKNAILFAMADALIQDTDRILYENKLDVEAARSKISGVMIDRLLLDAKRIRQMADGIRNVASLRDPVGSILEGFTGAEGIKIKKVSVPIGVVAVIYESRPNVTSDAAALCLKSGNVCILRGGKEAIRTNMAVSEALRKGITKAGFTPDFVNMVTDPSHSSAEELMKARGMVDVLIPRGGAGLINACVTNAAVPVIETGTGICTVYVHQSADFKKALDIIDNAKTQRPSVCNACETCLIDRKIAPDFLPLLEKRLVSERINNGLVPVELRLSEEALLYAKGKTATEEDFSTEFLDYILAIKLVDGVGEAISHIERHSTHHSESIVAEDEKAAEQFVAGIDSAAVYINASTRFTDGGIFGFGCEMGISTQKLHARGPMGLRELTTYKYIIIGNGQVRQ